MHTVQAWSCRLPFVKSKSLRLLGVGHLQNIRSAKICMHTVVNRRTYTKCKDTPKSTHLYIRTCTHIRHTTHHTTYPPPHTHINMETHTYTHQELVDIIKTIYRLILLGTLTLLQHITGVKSEGQHQTLIELVTVSSVNASMGSPDMDVKLLHQWTSSYSNNGCQATPTMDVKLLHQWTSNYSTNGPQATPPMDLKLLHRWTSSYSTNGRQATPPMDVKLLHQWTSSYSTDGRQATPPMDVKLLHRWTINTPSVSPCSDKHFMYESDNTYILYVSSKSPVPRTCR